MRYVNTIYALIESLWSIGFALGGRLRRPAVDRWSSPGRQRVLVVAPHPDDEAIGCAGTLLRHRQCNDEICVVMISDGRRSKALGLSPEVMAQRRRQEAAASAHLLRVDNLVWLGLPEGEWSETQLAAELRQRLDDFSPQIIYAPSRVDFHPEHLRVAAVLASLLVDSRPASFPLVRVYQVQVPLTAVLTNLVADTSAVAVPSEAALNAYLTQADNIGRALRQRRYAARFYGCRRMAEPFWQMTGQSYSRLHRGVEKQGPAPPFRSLRARPFGDPLAYLYGRKERLSLLRKELRQRRRGAED